MTPAPSDTLNSETCTTVFGGKVVCADTEGASPSKMVLDGLNLGSHGHCSPLKQDDGLPAPPKTGFLDWQRDTFDVTEVMLLLPLAKLFQCRRFWLAVPRV